MAIKQDVKLLQAVRDWQHSVEQFYHWFEKLSQVISSCKSAGYPSLADSSTLSIHSSVAELMQLQDDVLQFVANLENRPGGKQPETISTLIGIITADTQNIKSWTTVIQKALQTNSTGIA